MVILFSEAPFRSREGFINSSVQTTHKQKLVVKNAVIGGVIGMSYPKFYYNVFLFVGSNTLGTLIEMCKLTVNRVHNKSFY